jgi:hypothetical protein
MLSKMVVCKVHYDNRLVHTEVVVDIQRVLVQEDNRVAVKADIQLVLVFVAEVDIQLALENATLDSQAVGVEYIAEPLRQKPD